MTWRVQQISIRMCSWQQRPVVWSYEGCIVRRAGVPKKIAGMPLSDVSLVNIKMLTLSELNFLSGKVRCAPRQERFRISMVAHDVMQLLGVTRSSLFKRKSQ